MIVSMCAGWGQAKDGIADYAANLAAEMGLSGLDVRRIALRNYMGDKAFYKKASGLTAGSDICHIQFNYSYFNGELPYRTRFIDFARGVRAPMVMTAHEVRIEFQPTTTGSNDPIRRLVFNHTIPAWNLWSKAMHKNIYGFPKRIIAHTSEHVAKIRELVVDPEKVVLIPHGIPRIDRNIIGISGSEAKKKLGLEGKRVMSVFGFINGRKGYIESVDALARLPDSVCLVIAGGKMNEDRASVEYYDALLRKVSELRLGDRVIVTGYLEKDSIPAVMAASDICLAPFQSSAASGALSMCIGYNKPVIASDIPVHKEINERVACLELFKSGDAADLSAKVSGLIGEPERMKELSDKARQYSDEYGYPNIAKRTVELYREVSVNHRY